MKKVKIYNCCDTCGRIMSIELITTLDFMKIDENQIIMKCGECMQPREE